MADWLGMEEDGMFSPLLSRVDIVDDLKADDSAADDTAADDASTEDLEDSPPDPQDAAAAAAVRAVAHRREPSFDAVQRRRRLERIRDHARDVSHRVNDVSLARRELEEGRATVEGGEADGDDEVTLVATQAAAIVLLMFTAGIATYLATLWDSLPLVMRYFVIVTYVWLYSAATMILFQYLYKKQIEDTRRPFSALAAGDPFGGMTTERGESRASLLT